jgi:hypothetical protein
MTAIALNEAARLVLWRTQDLDAMRDFLYKNQSSSAKFGRLIAEAELREEWRQGRQGELCVNDTPVSSLEAK